MHYSSIGVCTPDQVCTCWVDDSVAEPGRWECIYDGQCPADYVCVWDYQAGVITHTACVRTCETENDSGLGLFCEHREPVAAGTFVWVPKTTCFAYANVGESCVGLDNQCSAVDGYNEGACRNLKCTYSCEDTSGDDNTWCASNTCTAHYCAF